MVCNNRSVIKGSIDDHCFPKSKPGMYFSKMTIQRRDLMKTRAFAAGILGLSLMLGACGDSSNDENGTENGTNETYDNSGAEKNDDED